MNKQNTFPFALSSSLISAYRECPVKFWYEYIYNIVPRAQSPHLVAGAAYAKGQEVFRLAYFRDRKSKDEALGLGCEAIIKEFGDFDPQTTYKTWDRVCCALVNYYDFYKPDVDIMVPAFPEGVPGVEFSFAVPLPILNPSTADPIFYAGKLDALMRMGDTIIPYDDKTTGSFSTTWAEQWKLRHQFTGYVWGVNQHGFKAKQMAIRGVTLQKTKIQHLNALVSRHNWMLDLWYHELLITVRKMVEDFQRNEWVHDFGSACTSYGGCGYTLLCESRDWESWVETEYQPRTWEPVHVESF